MGYVSTGVLILNGMALAGHGTKTDALNLVANRLVPKYNAEW